MEPPGADADGQGASPAALAASTRSLAERQAAQEAWRVQAEAERVGFGRAIDAQFARWGLTPTEREVATLLLQGHGHKQIVGWTGRSERTVRQHAVSVYQKSGIGGRAALAAFFLQDLLPDPDASAHRSLPSSRACARGRPTLEQRPVRLRSFPAADLRMRRVVVSSFLSLGRRTRRFVPLFVAAAACLPASFEAQRRGSVVGRRGAAPVRATSGPAVEERLRAIDAFVAQTDSLVALRALDSVRVECGAETWDRRAARFLAWPTRTTYRFVEVTTLFEEGPHIDRWYFDERGRVRYRYSVSDWAERGERKEEAMWVGLDGRVLRWTGDGVGAAGEPAETLETALPWSESLCRR